jgi:hypothetical protein
VLLIVVLEGREKTMCDSRFWLLRVLGVEGQLQLQQFSSLGRCCGENVGLNMGIFVVGCCSVVYCVADCCAGGQRENHV